MRGFPTIVGYPFDDEETWRPPPCPRCGAEQQHDGRWIDVTAPGDACRQLLPGRVWCSTPKCGQVCKVCRRDPGDVHGPDCGPLMADKLERPHIVDRSDCR